MNALTPDVTSIAIETELMNERMKIAVRYFLTKNSSQKIEEISSLLGLSIEAFSNAFYTRYEWTPAEYIIFLKKNLLL